MSVLFERSLAVALAALASAPAAAQDPAGARIPVRVIDGKLVVSCDVSTSVRRIPANLFVELDSLCGLQLHNRAAAPLRAESPDGTPRPITLHFPDFQLTVPKREHGPEEVYEDFTKYHSDELGENALVGTLGAQVLKEHHLTLDLAAGQLVLGPPRERNPEPATAEPGESVVPITLKNDLVWLPARLPGGDPAVLGVATSRYDTLLDEVLCEELGAPAGDVGTVRVGDYDLSRYVAFRPEEVVQVHADEVAGMVGLNVLEHFRVEIDRVNRYARIRPTASARFPEDDLAFFRARAEEEPGPLVEYLERYPDSRLALEAARLLLDQRLDEGGDAEDCAHAMRAIEHSHAEDLRCTAMLDLMEELAEAGHPALVLVAGEVGLESGRGDRYPTAVHQVHAKMGEVQLEAGAGREAWRHLLSAAFGLPEDGLVNLNLGRFYEREGRLKRAFSRYVQAVIQPESGPQALAALARVQSELESDEPFSVDLVEKLIAGKVHTFGAATRFQPDETNAKNRVVLVEFFTNAYLGNPERGGAIGGALGNEGLLGHFARENVALLSYHLPNPRPDPLVNELAEATAAERGIPGPWVHVVDGVSLGPGAAKPREAEEVYNRCRELVYDRLQEATDYGLKLDARLVEGRVEGALLVTGPPNTALDVRIVLAERGALFPGESGVVVHKMVARAALTGASDGVLFQPADGGMRVEFSRALAEIDAANERYLDEIVAAGEGDVVRVSTRVDPRQLSVVAYLRDRGTGEIVQAAQVEPQDSGEAAR